MWCESHNPENLYLYQPRRGGGQEGEKKKERTQDTQKRENCLWGATRKGPFFCHWLEKTPWGRVQEVRRREKKKRSRNVDPF